MSEKVKAVSRKEAAISKQVNQRLKEEAEFKKKRENDLRLSNSSAAMLQTCQQKWFHYKVNKYKPDSDSLRSDALEIGTVFHAMLEYTMHSPTIPKDYFVELLQKYQLSHKKAQIHAMLLKYLLLHKKSGLECIHCEYEIVHPFASGYIDAVMVDPKGLWYIVDLKTAARLSETLLKRLHNDYQLTLYSLFKSEMVKDLKLNKDKFRGVRYRSTTKPTLIRRSTETYVEYVKRCVKQIRSIDVLVPPKELNRKGIMETHKRLYDLSQKLRSGALTPLKNFKACDDYFRPCDYWSRCHGSNFTESPELRMLEV